MILECPSCSKRYLVDPRAVGTAGRTVRCAACKNEWFAMPEVEDELELDTVEPAFEEVEGKPIPKGSSVPAIHKESSPTPLSVKLSCAALLVLTLMVSSVYFRHGIVSAVPFMSGAFAAVGMAETDGVVLADLAYSKKPEKLKDRYFFSGYLVNTTDEPRKLPKLAIRLLGKDGVTIRERVIQADATLQPGEQKRFSFDKRPMETSADSVENIVVELGNSVELTLRK